MAVNFRTDLIMIVLTGKENGEFPERRHIQGFMKSTLIDRAIAKKADHGFRQTAVGDGVSCSQSDGKGFADNGVAPQKAPTGIKKMHGTAHPFADSGNFAMQFRHDFPRRNPPDQGMDMLPIGADDVVPRLGGMQHAHGYRFLTRIQVQKSGNLSLGISLGSSLFKSSCAKHIPEHGTHLQSIHGRSPVGIHPAPCSAVPDTSRPGHRA